MPTIYKKMRIFGKIGFWQSDTTLHREMQQTVGEMKHFVGEMQQTVGEIKHFFGETKQI